MSDEYEIEVIPVVIAEEPIELYKILKIENLVASGSEAKNLIAEGYVYVNGEVETRKRKKIMFGDIVGFNGEAYQILSLADMDESCSEGDDQADWALPVAGPEMENVVEPEYEAVNLESKSNKLAAKKQPSASSKPAGSKKKGRAAPFNF